MYPNYNQGSDKKNKKDGPEDNYKARARRDIKEKEKIKYQNNNAYNNKNENEIKFQNTKTKIKVTLYKNGFTLNNGHFRDKNKPENRKFIEQVERGIIPHELMSKGINELGILLEDRKNEEYIVNTISYTSPTYINGNLNINTTNINQNIYSNNIYPDPNINKNINTNITDFNYGNNYTTKANIPFITYPEQNNNNNIYANNYPNYTNNNSNYYPYQNQVQNYPNDILVQNINKTNNKNNYMNNLDINEIQAGKNKNARKTAKINDKNNMCLTPIGVSTRRQIFPKKEKNEKEKTNPLRTSSAPKKKKSTNIRTFGSWIKEEKEEEEKKKNEKNKKSNKDAQKEKKEEDKKFVAFGGEGKAIENVNVQGLHVNKNLKNVVNKYIPVCNFNIRLFNGEIIKCEFNHNQTLSDVYIYVKDISGSSNFSLLEGFPPRPLNQFDKSIKELKLENTTLTQKIN